MASDLSFKQKQLETSKVTQERLQTELAKRQVRFALLVAAQRSLVADA